MLLYSKDFTGVRKREGGTVAGVPPVMPNQLATRGQMKNPLHFNGSVAETCSGTFDELMFPFGAKGSRGGDCSSDISDYEMCKMIRRRKKAMDMKTMEGTRTTRLSRGVKNSLKTLGFLGKMWLTRRPKGLL